MKEEQAHERLLQALRDIEAQIESHVPPVAKPVMQAEVERLRSLSEQQKWILNACLMRIDRTILDCLSQMEECRQTRSGLAALNERLASLGAEPVPMPNHLPADTLGELILARVEELRVEGKIYRLGTASIAMNSTNGTVPSSFPPHRQTIV